jgi:hypothetical protein
MRLGHGHHDTFIGGLYSGEEFFKVAGELVRFFGQGDFEVFVVEIPILGEDGNQGVDFGAQEDGGFAVVADGITFWIAFGAGTKLPPGKDGTPFCKALYCTIASAFDGHNISPI